VISPEQWAFIRDLGFGGLLTVALIGGFRGWYVWAWQYKAKADEATFWRDLAMRLLPLAEKATTAALSEKRDA
jgi:hypothetical protein